MIKSKEQIIGTYILGRGSSVQTLQGGKKVNKRITRLIAVSLIVTVFAIGTVATAVFAE